MIQRYAKFWLFRKGSGTSFSSAFCIWFFKKKNVSHVMLTNQIFLSNSLYFLRSWAICILQLIFFPGCDVINFEINLNFLIKPFSYITKKVTTNIYKSSEQKSFLGKMKSIFHHFCRASIIRNCFRPENAPLT